MADKLAYLLFGDQSLDTHAFLADLFRQEQKGILAKAFLEQASHALRREIEQLNKLERARLPVFQTLQQLNERYHHQSRKHPGLDGALLCVTQLAHYIEYVLTRVQGVDTGWRGGDRRGGYGTLAIFSGSDMSLTQMSQPCGEGP